jgi:hypothetical protein
MRRKVSLLIDEALFRRASLEAARQEKQLSEVLAEALERYLEGSERPQEHGGIVSQTWGVLRMPRKKLARFLRC